MNISDALSLDLIKGVIGIDPICDDVEDIDHPAQALHDVYQKVNIAYLTSEGNKKKNRIERTVNALDFTNLYTNVRGRVGRLNQFVDALDTFFV